MANKKFFEYQDPINSFDFQRARIPFIKPGRYVGFDSYQVISYDGTNLGLRVGNAITHPITNDVGVVENFGAFVTRQGVVVTKQISDILTEGIPINLPCTIGSEIWYVLYASYSWVKASGGSSVSYSVNIVSPNLDPINPKPSEDQGLTDVKTQVVLGYFRIYGISNTTYTLDYFPNPSPKFNWDSTDFSEFAKLDSLNLFTKTQTLGREELTDTIVGNQLIIPDSGNTFTISLSQDTKVSAISASEPIGSMYILQLLHSGVLTIKTSAISGLPTSYTDAYGDSVWESSYGDILVILQTNPTGFILISMYPPRATIDSSDFAKLSSYNKFKSINYSNIKELSDSDVVNSQLSISGANIYNLTLNSLKIIDSIRDVTSDEIGSIITLQVKASSGSGINNTGNIVFPEYYTDLTGAPTLSLQKGQTITLLKTFDDGTNQAWALLNEWPINPLGFTPKHDWVNVTPQDSPSTNWNTLKIKEDNFDPQILHITGSFTPIGSTGVQVDTFSVPNFTFNSNRKHFLPCFWEGADNSVGNPVVILDLTILNTPIIKVIYGGDAPNNLFYISDSSIFIGTI